MTQLKLRPVEQWLSESELTDIFTNDYWNNIEIEKGKEFWINEAEDHEKLLDHLKKKQILDDYYIAEKKIIDMPEKQITVADLAAGVGWTSALLSRIGSVKQVHSVEISKHRIGHLFERVTDMFDGDKTKINRYLGSFYNTKFEDRSLDVVFMCQAFHHSERPQKLLSEVSRIVKPTGLVIMIGEQNVSVLRIIRKFLSTLIKQRKFRTNFFELFPADPVLGDHYYRESDYLSITSAAGFSCMSEQLPSGNALYVLRLKQKVT